LGAWNKKFYAIGSGEVKVSNISSKNSEDCHSRQLNREVKFDPDPINTCIEGVCDSYEIKCQKRNLDGSCPAPIEICISKNCKKYRSYCNILIKNTESDESYTFSFNENYITSNGQKVLVKKMKAFLEVGQERSIAWQYEDKKPGKCDYSNLSNLICEQEEEKIEWEFVDTREDKEKEFNGADAREDRERFDQRDQKGWKGLLNLAAILVIIAGIILAVVYVVRKRGKK